MRFRFYVKKTIFSDSKSLIWHVYDRVGKYNPFCSCYARVRAEKVRDALNNVEGKILQQPTAVKTPAAPTPKGEICAKFMYGYSCCFRSDRKCGSIACELHPRKLLLT